MGGDEWRERGERWRERDTTEKVIILSNHDNSIRDYKKKKILAEFNGLYINICMTFCLMISLSLKLEVVTKNYPVL